VPGTLPCFFFHENWGGRDIEQGGYWTTTVKTKGVRSDVKENKKEENK
jgi:hypothetical protein